MSLYGFGTNELDYWATVQKIEQFETMQGVSLRNFTAATPTANSAIRLANVLFPLRRPYGFNRLM